VTPTNTPPALALRPREAAKALGISARTLWTWTKSGLLPCVRVGRGRRQVVLYPVEQLRAWLAGPGPEAAAEEKGGAE